MQQEESGILETSPGAIALLIVFFLVVTLGIEHGLHHLKNFLKRRNKHGLLAAVTNLANELMLLGVASLLLTAIAPAVTKICLPAKSQMRPWLSNVQGCACCLTRTEGVSHCFIEVSTVRQTVCATVWCRCSCVIATLHTMPAVCSDLRTSTLHPASLTSSMAATTCSCMPMRWRIAVMVYVAVTPI